MAYDPAEYDPNSKGAPYSPLQLESGATLLARNGDIPPQPSDNGIEPIPLNDAIDLFRETPLLVPMYNTLEYNANNGTIGSTRAGTIWQLGAGNGCPALSDAVPSAAISPLNDIETDQWTGNSAFFTTAGWTNFLKLTGDLYLGKTDEIVGRYYVERLNHDNGKFAQTFSLTQAFCNETNTFIESSYNAENNYLGDTFTDMDNLVTADYTEVNLDTQGFGNDLKNLGNLINLANLDNYGFPYALIQQIAKIGGIVAPIVVALSITGVDEGIILNIGDPTMVITDVNQKKMYSAMQLIKGDDLEQILQLLGVVTPGINSLADLLNPVKIFPNSFSTITAPTCNGLRAVYLTTSGIINSRLETLLPPIALSKYARLQRIIPGDQALADSALSVSLQQITNIVDMTLPTLADSFLGIETNKGLPDVNAALTPVSSYATNFYENTLATGSGDQGTILTTDVIGTSTATVHGEKLANSTAVIATLSGGSYANLEATYTNMYDTIRLTTVGETNGNCSAVLIAGDPGNAIPDTYAVVIAGSANAGAGTYPPGASAPGSGAASITAAIQDAFDTGLITNGGNNIAGTASANSGECAILNDNFDAMWEFVEKEAGFQNDANLLFKDLSVWPRNKSSVYAMIGALNQYGLETKQGGTAQYIENISDINNSNSDIALGMQSVIGSLREGRTDLSTNAVGAGKANRVSADPAEPYPQAELSSSTYTSAEARNQIIT